MKVYQVLQCDCESTSIISVCSTLELAERELFKQRDLLIKEWKEMQEYTEKSTEEYCKKLGITYERPTRYEEMINNLSSDDYEKWDNYPHDTLTIVSMEVIEK